MLSVEPTAHETPVIQVIEQANSFVDIEPYFIDDKAILAALAAASSRGVIVRVIIDPRPYGISARLVANEVSELDAAGAQVKYAPPQYSSGETFDHAKFLLTDQQGIVGTENLDFAAFHNNREYLVVFPDQTPRRDLEKIFSADWYNRPAPSTPSLVVSPGSTTAIVAALDQPGQVYVESEEVGRDTAVLTALEAKGDELNLILPESAVHGEDSAETLEVLQQHGVQIHLMPANILYMHAKMIVGGNIAFVGSQNFSETSLEKNRETGVYLAPAIYAPTLKATFAADWSISFPFKGEKNDPEERGGKA